MIEIAGEDHRRACLCMECRIRAALHGGPVPPGTEFAMDLGEGLTALLMVTGELLAHASNRSAKEYARKLLEVRKAWLKHPRVAAQQPPAGNA